MSIMISAFITVAVVFAGFAGVMKRPWSLRVERRVENAGAADVIFAIISAFRKWSSWLHFDSRDPGMSNTHMGRASAPDACNSWSGNLQTGAGHMTIKARVPDQLAQLAPACIRLCATRNRVRCERAAPGAETWENWIRPGTNLFLGKELSSFMDKARTCAQ
jgi:hypothetical protein